MASVNPAYLLSAVLVAPIVAVAVVQRLVVGHLGGKITAGWAGLVAYLLTAKGLRLLIGVSVWSLVAGLLAALAVGLVRRVTSKRTKRSDSPGDPS